MPDLRPDELLRLIAATARHGPLPPYRPSGDREPLGRLQLGLVLCGRHVAVARGQLRTRRLRAATARLGPAGVPHLLEERRAPGHAPGGRQCTRDLLPHGNHTIAERMYRYDPAVMLYAPLHTMIWGSPDGATHFTFDRPSDQFGSFAHQPSRQSASNSTRNCNDHGSRVAKQPIKISNYKRTKRAYGGFMSCAREVEALSARLRYRATPVGEPVL